MIDGDVIGFGRQPSLTYASIGGHRVRVLENSNTLSLNAVACPLYNADFDGDAMLAVVPRSKIAINEAATLSAVGNWFISYQTQSPAMGLVQDGMIGTAVFSASGINFNKWRAMDILAHVNTDMYLRKVDFSKNQQVYSSRDLISMTLPSGINVVGKTPLMCRDAFVSFIKYHEADTKVEIIDGKHITGVLDKATVGNENGSLFHVINNSYGVEHAFDCMHAFQRMSTAFMYYHGFTVGIKDTDISAEAQQTLKANIRQLLEQAALINQKLDRHEIYPPIGEELEDYYETLILNALQPGDLLINPIMADIDYYNNGMARLITVGSKGDVNNFSSINGGLCQQTINGRRPPRQFGYQRTSPFYRRYENDPVANGFVMQSYREGIESRSLLFIAQDARNNLMAIALGTALGGEQNRNAAVTLSSLITDYRRGATKNSAIVQLLYADTGTDPRKVENIKITTISTPTELFNSFKISSTNKRIAKRYQTAETQKALDEEFKALLDDREFYRKLSLRNESNNPGMSIMSDTKKLPFNVFRIMRDAKVAFQLNENKQQVLEDDPVEMINAVKRLCEKLPLAYYNRQTEKLADENKFIVPDYIRSATRLCCIAIRSHLAMKILLAENINMVLLNKIIDTIWRDFKNSFMSYGMAVGVIASQCISEPLTQFILHAKHRTGVAGNKTSPLIRFKEILGAKPTKRMKNVSMTIMVPPEHRKDKSWVLNKCNYIEVMKFERFITTASIFFESYGHPVHPKYVHEEKMIKEFEARNAGLPKPADLSKWVIRFEIDVDELILRSITLDNIVSTLRKNPNIFVVHNRETEDRVIIRCYIRNIAFKSLQSSSVTDARKWVEYIERIRNKLASTTIRGISGINRAYLDEIPFTEIQADGSTKLEKMYCINTSGVNMSEVLDLDYVDRYNVQTDSFLEMEETYGIVAARNMIIGGLMALHAKNIYTHCSIYADEMTFTGHITSIEKTGLGQREKTNVMLRVSFQYPNQMLEEAAMGGYTNEITGISAPLMIGRVPDLGSSYSKVVMNTEFVTKNKKTLNEQINEL
jgi:DNA-directed RNA polymerase beta' subunit